MYFGSIGVGVPDGPGIDVAKVGARLHMGLGEDAAIVTILIAIVYVYAIYTLYGAGHCLCSAKQMVPLLSADSRSIAACVIVRIITIGRVIAAAMITGA